MVNVPGDSRDGLCRGGRPGPDPAWLAPLLTHGPAAVAVRGPSGAHLWVNPTFHAVHGTSDADVIGRPLDAVFPAEVAARHREVDEQVLARGGPLRWQLPVSRGAAGSGAVEPGEASGCSFRLDLPGGGHGVGSCYVDASDLGRVRERLTRSEELYRGLFERSAVPLAVYGLDQRVRDANPAYCRLLGYRRSEIVGRHVRALITEATVVATADRWLGVVHGRIDGYRALADGVRRDGSLVPSQTIVSLVRDQRGRPSMIYAMSAPTILATGDPAGVLHALAGVRLSARETAVLEGLAEGLTTQDLAHRLDLTPQGVEYHVRKLVTTFGAANRTAVVARAYATGLLVVGLWPPRVAGRDAVSGPDGPGR